MSGRGAPSSSFAAALQREVVALHLYEKHVLNLLVLVLKTKDRVL